MTWTVTSVPSSELRAVWLTALALLKPAIALSGGRIDSRSVYEWLADGRYLLWFAYAEDKVPRAAFLTRTSVYPRKRVLTIDCAGGSEMDGWLEEADRIFRAFSRESGLDGVELFGRNGWARALKRYGWHVASTQVETD